MTTRNPTTQQGAEGGSDEQARRLLRIEEGQLYAERQAEQFGELFLDMQARIDALTRRLARLESRMERLSESGAEPTHTEPHDELDDGDEHRLPGH